MQTQVMDCCKVAQEFKFLLGQKQIQEYCPTEQTHYQSHF